MAEKKDYYQVLGITRNADGVEIKSAYRKMAMKYHPDRNPGDKDAEENFKYVNEAYSVLSDSNKKQMYDQYGHEGVNNAGGFGGFGGGAGGFADINDIFGSVFGDIFGGSFGGGRGRASRATRGSDLKLDIEVTLEEAFTGLEKEVKYDQLAQCPDCNGLGAENPSDIHTCPECRGTGTVQFSQGFFSMRQQCPACGGQGTRIDKPCKTCRGQGKQNIKKNIMLKVPGGVRSGVTLRVSGGGDTGTKGGPSGDLYVEIHVKPHKIFKRDGDDLVRDIKITYPDAALGSSFEIQNLMKEELKVSVPKGTQFGSVIKIEGQGMPKLAKKGNGDLLLNVNIDVPKKMSAKQRQLMEALAHELKDGKDKSFLEKMFSQ